MTHFGVVEQAIKSMKTVNEYINVGMDTALDVAQDFYESSADNNKELDSLRSVMRDYVQMEFDLKYFMEAVEEVKNQAKSSREPLNLEELLDQNLEEMRKRNAEPDLTEHEKYIDLEQKISEMQNPVGDTATVTVQMSEVGTDEDIAMTQSEVNTKCPITGCEMEVPVTNKHCGHNYDKKGILHYIKSKKNRARCPIGGCANENLIQKEDLIENKELKRHIERKNRMGKRAKKPT